MLGCAPLLKKVVFGLLNENGVQVSTVGLEMVT